MNNLRRPLATLCRNYIQTTNTTRTLFVPATTKLFRLYSTEQPQQQQQQQTSNNTSSSQEQENTKEAPVELNLGKRFFRLRNWIIPGVILTVVAYYAAEQWRAQTVRELEVQSRTSVTGDAKTSATFVAGTPAIGGSFTLVDCATGKPITDSLFRGKWMFVYFGFCNCPDICPEEMKKMTKALEMMDPKIAEQIQPIFITVDPHRDSIKAVESYLKDFHPRFIGLTGTPEQIKQTCKKYRVFYSAPDFAEGKEDYLVDHSIFIYLMDPNGFFSNYYARIVPAEQVAKSVTEVVKKRQAEKSK